MKTLNEIKTLFGYLSIQEVVDGTGVVTSSEIDTSVGTNFYYVPRSSIVGSPIGHASSLGAECRATYDDQTLYITTQAELNIGILA